MENLKRRIAHGLTLLLMTILPGCPEAHPPDETDATTVDAARSDVDALVVRPDSAIDDGGPDDTAVPEDANLVDAAAPEPCTTPGVTEAVSCGMCGTIDRFCTAGRTWAYGVCEGETGACLPGTIGDVTCGNCGMQPARCNASCAWEGTSACAGEGVCAPGTRTRNSTGCAAGETREALCSAVCSFDPVGDCAADACPTPGATESTACGMCGTIDRFCNAAHAWEYGTCTGEGTCMPGTTSSVACGMCGTATARCSDTCTMTTGACTGEGTCAPGTRMSTSAGCAAGEFRTVECDAACGYTIEVTPCAVAVCGTGPACALGTECCGGTCVDTTSDLANCGMCGHGCDVNLANACVAGECSCGTGPACVIACSFGTCFPI